MTLRLYNTLHKRDESFTAIDEANRRVSFYSCGPTVYDFAHIGNFRSFLNADVLRRTLELFGYEVRHVMNITDVGHMTDDAVADGSGEDKMQLAAKRLLEDKKSGKLPADAQDIDPNDPYAVAAFYTDAFLEDARALGMKIAFEVQDQPKLMPRATAYVPAMIEMIHTLVDKGHAYVASDGVVYFDVQSFEHYGKLSGNTPDQIRSGEGGRVDQATQAIKKHPADFMLWKPDPTHLMRWPSPWGEGYPGWHIECSAMAQSLLGQLPGANGEIDLHSGGEDNIFPHHECEIAQSCCATGSEYFARYWFHTRFLVVEGEKMSKSKGNFFTVRDLIAKGATPAAIRLELIKTHYRSNANFTFQGLQNAQRQIERWAKLQQWLRMYQDRALSDTFADGGPLQLALPAFKEALMNDLNIAGAIGVLSEAAAQHTITDAPPAGHSQHTYADELDALHAMNSVLGVLDLQREADAAGDEDERDIIEAKIAQRNAARAAKDWAAADAARDELLAMGIAIKDGPEGTTWSRVVR
jgi:cysteinyl-tRNA synthetase